MFFFLLVLGEKANKKNYSIIYYNLTHHTINKTIFPCALDRLLRKNGIWQRLNDQHKDCYKREKKIIEKQKKNP